MTTTANIQPQDVDRYLNALANGATLGDIAGITDDTLEAGYGLAFSLFNSGKYRDAETLFKALCLYAHGDERFWMGLAACRQANNDFRGAIDAYSMASVAGALGNPAPPVYGGLCYLKLDDPENAAALFDAALELGEAGNSEHKALREKARAMLEIIRSGK
jgi:type III secretion system low calcium response chaperone LcrH/SycD